MTRSVLREDVKSCPTIARRTKPAPLREKRFLSSRQLGTVIAARQSVSDPNISQA
jgi:hypothetical protein